MEPVWPQAQHSGTQFEHEMCMHPLSRWGTILVLC